METPHFCPLFNLPKDIHTQIATKLEFTDWLNFKASCKLFDNNAAERILGGRKLIPLEFKVFTGHNHIFVLTKNGKLYACGENSDGELGLGDIKARLCFTEIKLPKEIGSIKEIKAGNGNTFILSHSGKLYACGKNQSGQLGLGDIKNRRLFVRVEKNINAALHIRQIVTGFEHTLLLLSDGTARGCGTNDTYQLGLESITDNLHVFKPITIKDSATPIRAIIAGDNHTILWLTNDDLYVCGDNTYRQLGPVGNQPYVRNFTKISLDQIFSAQTKGNQILFNEKICIKQIGTDTKHTLIKMSNGELYGCGTGIEQQLNLFHDYNNNFTPLFNKTAQRFFLGHGKIFFLSGKKNLFEFGKNKLGQLELNDIKDKSLPIPISINSIEESTDTSVLQIETTHTYTFLLLSNGKWYVSGGDTGNYVKWRITATTVKDANPKVFTPCNFNQLLGPEQEKKAEQEKKPSKRRWF